MNEQNTFQQIISFSNKINKKLMSRQFSRDYSLKTFENEEQCTDDKNEPHHLPNFFTHASDKHENYSDVWFKSNQAHDQNQNKRSGASLNRMNCSSYMSLNKNQSRKPLNDILKSNKDSSVQGSATKPHSRPPKQKSFYKTAVTQGNELNLQKLQARTAKKSQSKEKHQNHCVTHQQLNEFYGKNFSLNRLKESVKHIKTLQQEVRKQGSRSKSNKKKGLECTLYEKSLQKKINYSDIKSTKKLITIKKKFQKTQADWGTDGQAGQKEIKKILLKKKNKQQTSFNNTNCFNSVALQKSKQKRMSVQRGKGSVSRAKIGENIRQVSRNKKDAYAELSRSMHMIIQECKNQQFTVRQRSSNSKSVERPRITSIKKHQLESQSKKPLSQSSSIPHQTFHINLPSSSKGHKIIINQKIQSSLDKIHQKYRFILNYMTDFDIIGKLNGYQIAQIDECKWILLVIDEVYEMIKHSEQTKLKGIEYSREYEFRSEKKKDCEADEKEERIS